MEYSTSSGMSKVFVDGKLVDQKGFMTESDGSQTSYVLNNNNNYISGEITNNQLREDDLMQLLDYPASSVPLLQRLETDFPISKQKKATKRKNKNRQKRSKKNK
jgi:hypothetical protein